MFSIGLVLIFLGFIGGRMTRQVYPWDRPSPWNDIWFGACLGGFVLIVASLCIFAWRQLP